MSSKEIEQEVGATEAAVVDRIPHLDGLLEAAIPAMAAKARAFVDAEVRRHIEDHADKLAAIGTERLRQFKVNVAQLVEQMESVMRDEVGAAEEWAHRRPVSERPSNHNESFLGAAYRRAISRLGQMIADAKLMSSSDLNTWSRTSTTWRYGISTAFAEYSGRPPRPGEPLDPIAAYQSELGTFDAQRSKLERLRSELTKARGKELWDSL